jgi:hypothetical protein
MTYADWLIMTGGKTTITEEYFNKRKVEIEAQKQTKKYCLHETLTNLQQFLKRIAREGA